MPQRHSFIATLGGLIYFERADPESSEKVSSFGPALALLATGLGGSIALESASDAVVLNGGSVPIGAPGALEVAHSLRDHEIHTVQFPTDPSAVDFERFAGVFARDAGSYKDVDQVRTALGKGFSAEAEGDALPSERLPTRKAYARALVGPDESDGTGDNRIRMVQPISSYAGIICDLSHHEYESRAADAERGDDDGALLDVVLAVAEAEAHSQTEVSGASFRALLRQILTPQRLLLLARQVGEGARPEETTGVLRRVGQDATDALMRRLVEARTQGERRGYFRALTHMTEGTDVIVRHIGHELWYVVRNAADLAGEMDLAHAVPALVEQADHSDDRARRSIARALAMICTLDAHQPLGLLIGDAALQVRVGAITHLNPRRSSKLGWPLARQLELETSVELQQALVKILSELGTEEARRGLEAFVVVRPDSPAAAAARERLARPDRPS